MRKRVQSNRWGPGDDSVNNKQVHLPWYIAGPRELKEPASGRTLQLECPETEDPGGGSTCKWYNLESLCAPFGPLSEGWLACELGRWYRGGGFWHLTEAGQRSVLWRRLAESGNEFSSRFLEKWGQCGGGVEQSSEFDLVMSSGRGALSHCKHNSVTEDVFQLVKRGSGRSLIQPPYLQIKKLRPWGTR